MGQRILERSVTQETVANHPCQGTSTPVAMPRRYDLARCALHRAELWRQYITRANRLGRLMRHFYFLPLALPIALLAPGMGQTSRAGALIATASLALPNASGQIPALLGAVALAPVALRAHHNHGVAMHARERPSTPGLRSRHWRSPGAPNACNATDSKRWT